MNLYLNLLVKTGSRLPNSMIDLTTINIDMKIDPFIELSVERVFYFLIFLIKNLYYKRNNLINKTLDQASLFWISNL